VDVLIAERKDTFPVNVRKEVAEEVDEAVEVVGAEVVEVAVEVDLEGGANMKIPANLKISVLVALEEAALEVVVGEGVAEDVGGAIRMKRRSSVRRHTGSVDL